MIAITLLHTIFNYTIAVFPSRLSRARRVVENAFGILAMKWMIFRAEIEAQPKFVELYVKVCCLLHNFLIDSNRSDDYDSDLEDDDDVEEDLMDINSIFPPFDHVYPDNPIDIPTTAINNRNKLANYFMLYDVLPWQEATVTEDGYQSP